MTVKPYIVTARRRGHPPVRIDILARDVAQAITTAQELYPDHLISTAHLAPDWQDSPA